MTYDTRAERRIPVLAWVLVAVAALQVAIWMAVNWYRVFGPYLILRLEDLSSIITGVAPFLLGAAVLVGAPRWPAGRSWLLAGAGFAALHGVMRTASDAWWAWRGAGWDRPEGLLQVALALASLVAVAAAALTPLCLAAALGRVVPPRRMSPPAAGLILVVGLAAAAAGLGLGAREIAWTIELGSGEPAIIAVGVAYRLLTTLEAIALVVLALAALRALPPARVVPEVLVTAGGTVAAAALAVSWAGQALLSIEAQGAQQAWVWTVPWALESIGMVLIIVGFAVAGRGPASARRSTEGGPASAETVAR